MNSSTENHEPFHSCEYKENLDILRQTYLFSRLPIEALKVLAYLCTKEIYRAGDFLFRQGEEDGQALILLSGTARLIRENDDGEYTFRDYTPRDFIGAMSLLGKINRLYSLKALTDTTCLVLEREKFSRTLQQFPTIVPVIVQALTERINAWEEKLLTQHADHCQDCKSIVGVSLV
jgi:CRP-like cAMP-binding protein